MRKNQTQLVSAVSMGASVTSIGLDLNQQVLGSISAIFSGSPVGTFKLQISNDIVPVNPSATNPVGSDPAGAVVNWTDYTGSSQAISASGDFTWNLLDIGYRWIRLVYTRSSGSGTLNVYSTTKGV